MMKIDLDMREFNQRLAEYKKFNKRAPSEIINNKCYFIARNATNTTKAVVKSTIVTEMNAPSRDDPKLTVAEAIIAHRQRKTANWKTEFTQSELGRLAKKLISVKQRSVNFLRSGWLPAIRILFGVLDSAGKRGAPKQDRTTKKYGVDKGTAKPAPAREKTVGVIENNVSANESSRVHSILVDGLKKALAQEMASMEAYIQKKYAEGARQFNR